MKKRNVYETARQALLPVLLDNTPAAHRLSARLFRRYGIVSLVFGKPRLRDLFDPTSHTLRVPFGACDRVQIEALIDLAQESDGYLPALIPCSDRARELVTRHKTDLESHFLLLDSESIFSLSLLTENPSHLT